MPQQLAAELNIVFYLYQIITAIVTNPAEYNWSSYPEFIGTQKAAQFLQTDWLLSNFGKSKNKAKRNYKDFVEGADIKTLENPNRQVIEGFILGDSDFINWVKDTFLSGKKDEKEIPQLMKLKAKIQLETILKAVCREFTCNEEQMITKGRKKNKAREVAIYFARELSRMSCRNLGLYFGQVSGALITIMHNRIAEEAAQNRRLKRRIENIKKRIFNI
jgi:hypothetical protein